MVLIEIVRGTPFLHIWDAIMIAIGQYVPIVPSSLVFFFMKYNGRNSINPRSIDAYRELESIIGSVRYQCRGQSLSSCTIYIQCIITRNISTI